MFVLTSFLSSLNGSAIQCWDTKSDGHLFMSSLWLLYSIMLSLFTSSYFRLEKFIERESGLRNGIITLKLFVLCKIMTKLRVSYKRKLDKCLERIMKNKKRMRIYLNQRKFKFLNRSQSRYLLRKCKRWFRI